MFNQSSWTAVTLYRILARYGLSFFNFKAAPKAMVERYLQLYSLQQAGVSADTPHELLQRVELYNLTQVSFQEEVQVRLLLHSGPKAWHCVHLVFGRLLICW